jgi:hypothetical protein
VDTIAPIQTLLLLTASRKRIIILAALIFIAMC